MPLMEIGQPNLKCLSTQTQYNNPGSIGFGIPTIVFYGVFPILDSSLRISSEHYAECGDISNPRATYTDARVFELGWSSATQHCAYEVAYGLYDTPPDDFQTAITDDTVYTVAGMAYRENYAFRVRAACCYDDGDTVWMPWSDTVQFSRPYYLLRVYSGDNTLGQAFGGGIYERNQQVTVHATAYTDAIFTGWDNGETDNPLTFTLTQDTTLIALFESTIDTSSHGDDTTAVNSVSTHGALLVPNPAKSDLTITATSRISSVELLGMTGQPLLHHEVDALTTTLDISTLPSGTYIVRIRTAQGILTRKLVVTK